MQRTARTGCESTSVSWLNAENDRAVLKVKLRQALSSCGRLRNHFVKLVHVLALILALPSGRRQRIVAGGRHRETRRDVREIEMEMPHQSSARTRLGTGRMGRHVGPAVVIGTFLVRQRIRGRIVRRRYRPMQVPDSFHLVSPHQRIRRNCTLVPRRMRFRL